MHLLLLLGGQVVAGGTRVARRVLVACKIEERHKSLVDWLLSTMAARSAKEKHKLFVVAAKPP